MLHSRLLRSCASKVDCSRARSVAACPLTREHSASRLGRKRNRLEISAHPADLLRFPEWKHIPSGIIRYRSHASETTPRMVVFWILAALMTAVALAFVLVPLLRARRSQRPLAGRGQPRRAARPAPRDRSRRRARACCPPKRATRPCASWSRARRGRSRSGTRVARVPRRAAPGRRRRGRRWPCRRSPFGLYLADRQAARHPTRRRRRRSPTRRPTTRRSSRWSRALATKVSERPDDVQGWALLARSMSALGRFEEAVDAYEHLAKLAPNDPQVLADYADALAHDAGPHPGGQARTSWRSRRSRIDPSNPEGPRARRHRGDRQRRLRGRDEALAARSRRVLPPDSPDQEQIAAIIDEIRARAAAGRQAAARQPPATRSASATRHARRRCTSESITGLVSLALRRFRGRRHRHGDALHLRPRRGRPAHAAGRGARQRARAADDASPSTTARRCRPSVKLSAAEAVRIEARISKSGNAMPQPGDLVGTSAVVKPGARDVKVVIDQVLP